MTSLHLPVRRLPALRSALLLAALLFVIAAPAHTQAEAGDGDTYSAAEVKAAFLFHFATYVDWPAQEKDGALVFALLDAPRVAGHLEQFVRGRNIGERPVRVRRIQSLSDLTGAEVLFIGANRSHQLARLIEQVAGPTLVVTDSAAGLSDGGMINFRTVDRRVRFEIALPAAERAGLSLSSRLLSAALRVRTSQCLEQCWERDALGRLRPALRLATSGLSILEAAIRS